MTACVKRLKTGNSMKTGWMNLPLFCHLIQKTLCLICQTTNAVCKVGPWPPVILQKWPQHCKKARSYQVYLSYFQSQCLITPNIRHNHPTSGLTLTSYFKILNKQTHLIFSVQLAANGTSANVRVKYVKISYYITDIKSLVG